VRLSRSQRAHHVAGYYADDPENLGWWDNMIGPGKPVDTDKFFVVGVNTSAAASARPARRASIQIREALRFFVPRRHGRGLGGRAGPPRRPAGDTSFAAVMEGASARCRRCNGRSAIRTAIRNAIVVAAAPKALGQNIAFNEVAAPGDHHRPGFPRRGLLRARRGARRGLRLARMIGHITYLSDDAMMEKFGRALRGDAIQFHFDVDFEIESTCATRATSSPSISTPTPIADHAGARLFRPGGGRDDDLSKGCCGTRPVSGGVVHLGLAFRAVARERDRQGAPGQSVATCPTRRSTRRTGTMRSCSTTRATTRSCGPISTASSSVYDRQEEGALSGRSDFRAIALVDQADSTVLDLGCGRRTAAEILKQPATLAATESTSPTPTCSPA